MNRITGIGKTATRAYHYLSPKTPSISRTPDFSKRLAAKTEELLSQGSNRFSVVKQVVASVKNLRQKFKAKR